MEYMGKKIWQEDPAAADDYRQRYVDGITAYIRKMNGACKKERRSFMPPEEKIVCDIEYIRKRSIWLDVKLIIKTVIVVVLGRF